MYNLLVVDDEKFAVQGISRAIDWSDMRIGEIYEATSMRLVADLLADPDKKVHVLIVDIEMPGTSGFEVMERVKQRFPDIETIVLTAHANFDYAQKAIRMGSFSYILKPFKHDQLKEVVKEAIGKIGKEEEQLEVFQQYQRYLHLWENRRPVLVERFWQELLMGRTVPTDGYLDYAATLYGLSFGKGDRFIPILISLESWNKALTTREEAILEFALGNIAEELFAVSMPGDIVKVPNGHVAILHAQAGKEAEGEAIRNLCEQLIEACQKYLQCTLTCYVGGCVAIHDLPQAYAGLLDRERLNINKWNTVLFADKEAEVPSGVAAVKWPDLGVLIETGKKEELALKLCRLFVELESEAINAETLEAFYFNLVNEIYHLLREKRLPVREVFRPHELTEVSVTASLARLKLWTERVVYRCMDALASSGACNSAIVDRVCAYIRDHMAAPIGRDELAEAVHLNPDYLSRLFKKEKGMSLSDYILMEKISRAKELLVSTNLKVSTVAEEIGYVQYTYFSKLFRKIVGVTPQEYRKTFQAL